MPQVSSYPTAAIDGSDTFLGSDSAGAVKRFVAAALMPSGGMFNGTLTVSASGSALTVALKTKQGTDPTATDPVYFFFRNSNATSGDYIVLTVTAALSFTVSSGSTLGVTSSKAFRVWFTAFADGAVSPDVIDTVRIGAVQCAIRTVGSEQIFALQSGGLQSSTAEGGAGAADSAGTIYTGIAVTNRPMILLGYAEWNATGITAGTWTTTNLDHVQLFGFGVKQPGDVVQKISATSAPSSSITSTTYVTTTKTLSITPKSAANLIEAFAVNGNSTSASDQGCTTMISRGNTNNTNMIGAEGSMYGQSGGTLTISQTNQAFDTPNTTSSQLYCVQNKKVSAGAGNVGLSSSITGIMVLTEYQT